MHLRRTLALIAVLFVSVTGLVQAQAYFADVSEKDPHYTAIIFLRALGILEGYDDNTFRPDQPVARGEFAKLLVEALQVQPDPAQYHDCFEDVAKEWFAPYVCYAKKMGMVQGVDAKHFRPENKVTHAEAIKMTLQGFAMQQDLPKVTKSLFKDVTPTDWYAPYIHRAALDNLYSTGDFAFPNTSMNRGEAAEILYRTYLVRLLHMPQFDAAKAMTFLMQEMKLDLGLPSQGEAPAVDGDVAQQLAIYKDVIDQLRVLHPNGAKIPLKDFIYASMEGLAHEVGDPYTLFLRPDASQEFTDSLNGNLEGLGVEIAEDAQGALILNVFPGSPAQVGGVQAGDIVTKADNTDLAGKSSEEIVGLMRGKEGTSVTLQILRGTQTLSMQLTRAKIHIPSVVVEDKTGIEVVHVTQFGGATAVELHDALKALPASAKGIVLDLRNNGGGYMDIAQTIAGYFLPKGTKVFSIKDAQNTEEAVNTIDAPMTTLPMTVLVNGYSASAAEVLAGALRDNNRATLVGETTFGKGTVQTLVTYVDGSMLRVTIAQWYTPKGDSVGDVNGKHTGLTPNTVVVDDKTTAADEQLDTAIRLLQ